MSETTNIVLAGHKVGRYTAKTNQKILSDTLSYAGSKPKEKSPICAQIAFTSPNSVNVHRQNLGLSLHPRLSEVACGLVYHLQLPQHDYSQSVTHGSWTDEFEVSIPKIG
jgi:hypothetical protein